MGIVSTIKDRCKSCYSCVRTCPARAVRISEGQAEVIEERCIQCGNCVRVCAQNAKKIESHIDRVEELLNNGTPTVACLAPSFPSAFPGTPSERMAGALKRAGFSEVWEIAFGAELISKEYKRLFKEKEIDIIISSPCPAIVSYIEKHLPSLIPFMAPILSPMTALGRLIKRYRPGSDAVFIGPCVAKKHEVMDENVEGLFYAALTFKELKELFSCRSIDIQGVEPEEFDGPEPYIGRSFPISGGLLKTAALDSDILDSDIIVTEGKDRCLDILMNVSKGRIKAKFLDLLFCEGCINGPLIDNDLSIFQRKDIVIDYISRKKSYRDKSREDIDRYGDIDLTRGFTNRQAIIRSPSEEEIREILRKIKKERPEDELNCGACGFSTCREKAISVCQGIAELEMCFPYLVSELEELNIKLRESMGELEKSHQELTCTYRELKDMQNQMLQSEKLASMGQLAASIAHEINNPLTGVLTYTRLIKKKLKDVPPSSDDIQSYRKYLSIMERETDRCGHIVKNLLDFARQSEPSFKPVNINQIMEEALGLLYNQINLNEISVTKEMKPLPHLTADYSQIQQIFVNILMNAVEAMGKGGEISITTGYEEADERVRVEIADTGCGIEEEDLPRIFEPFFTRKPSGTGLGLAVAYGIINNHHGEIKVETEKGAGTTFIIMIPVRHGS